MKPRTLEEKQAEKARLQVKYNAQKRREWTELCEQEPRLPALRRAIRRHTSGPEFLSRLADSWIRTAPERIRRTALNLILAHSDTVARREGRQPLDDPLPPATNVFFVARAMLAVR